MNLKPFLTTALVGLASAALSAPALAGTAMNLGSRTFTQTECQGYVVKVTGKDPVVRGGALVGKISDRTDWRDCKGPNGAGYYIGRGRASGDAVFDGGKLHNIGTDGFRIAAQMDSVTFKNIEADRIRDDVFSLSRKPGTKFTIRDSKVRGYAILSSRNTGGDAHSAYSLDIDGLVAETIPYTIGDAKRRDGNVFKLDDFRGTPSTWKIRNSVFLVHKGTGINTPNATWENVTFVNADGGEFPLWNGGKDAPKGVKVTNDVSVYKRAVARFDAAHR